jgi:hypothetical protein
MPKFWLLKDKRIGSDFREVSQKGRETDMGCFSFWK